MTIEETLMDAAACWFCRQPIHAGERVNRSPHGKIADCLRHDALTEGIRPTDGDVPNPVY